MKITGFIPSSEEAATIVAWTLSFASQEDDLEFLCYESDFSDQTQLAVKEALLDYPKEVVLKSIQDLMIVKAIVDQTRKAKSDLLITSKFEMPEIDGITQNSNKLVNASPCRTLCILKGEVKPQQVKKILFLPTDFLHDRATFNLLDTFRKAHEVKITIGGVEEHTGAKEGQSGERTIKTFLHEAGVDADEFEIKVVMDRLIHRGINKCFEDHDLVIAGMDAEKYLNQLENSLGDASVAIVKRMPPLRFKSLVEWLPRINPADHADLLHDLRQGSVWGPDFMVMLGLAAAVSALGLLQDSPAVVIGSMLLAPLMTPMMGLGLALAQANTRLMRLSIKSIIFGFLLVLSISFLLGFITPSGETLPNEVLARGTPNVLDLLIAVFAASAAAFAMGRPNIVGAIAGVAIATALVPPACSVGISLASGEFLNAMGAGLLFFANLIAIMAASSFTFTILGVTSKRALKRHRRVARLSQIGLVLVLLGLFAPMSATLLSTINEGRNVALAYPVTRAVSRAVNERVNQDEGVEIILIARDRTEHAVIVHLASREDLPISYAAEIKQIVRNEMKDPDIPVHVVAVRSIWVEDEP